MSAYDGCTCSAQGRDRCRNCVDGVLPDSGGEPGLCTDANEAAGENRRLAIGAVDGVFCGKQVLSGLQDRL